jgi:rubrerythrin
MTDKTSRNLQTAFVAEAKAHFRLLAYSETADEEGLPEVAALFRAVAEAERIHATQNLRLLGEAVVKDTETNLEASLGREERAAEFFYPQFIRDAEAEADRRAAISFAYARDVEEGHASLYKGALRHMISASTPIYQVCQVCGYIAEGEPPQRCPVCNATQEQFKRVV